MTDWEMGRSRGFGFLTLEDDMSVCDAIQDMHGQELCGRKVWVVDWAKERPRRWRT